MYPLFGKAVTEELYAMSIQHPSGMVGATLPSVRALPTNSLQLQQQTQQHSHRVPRTSHPEKETQQASGANTQIAGTCVINNKQMQIIFTIPESQTSHANRQGCHCATTHEGASEPHHHADATSVEQYDVKQKSSPPHRNSDCWQGPQKWSSTVVRKNEMSCSI